MKKTFSSARQMFWQVAESPVLVVTLITILGAIIRFYHLGYKSLWFDEAVMYWISNAGETGAVIAQNAARNSAPPLFALVLKSMLGVGDSEEFLRFLPWIGGGSSIPAMYFLGKQFLSRNVTYLVTFLVAIAYSQVNFSQYLREYSWTFFFAAMTLALFARMLENYSIRTLAPLTIVMLIDIFLQYGLALLIVGINLVYVVYYFREREMRDLPFTEWIVSQLFVLGAVVFVYSLSLKEQMVIGWGASGYLKKAYWDGSVNSIARFAFTNTIDLFEFAYSGVLFLTIALIGIGAILKFKKGRMALLLFGFPIAVTLGLGYLNIYPYIGSRHDIFLMPMIYVCFGFGVEWFLKSSREYWAGILVLFILISMGITDTYRNLTFRGVENMRPITETLSQEVMDGDQIYVYHWAEPAFSYYFRDEVGEITIGSASHDDSEWFIPEIEELLQTDNRLWLIFSHCLGNECEDIPQYISQEDNFELVSSSRGVSLYLVE